MPPRLISAAELRFSAGGQEGDTTNIRHNRRKTLHNLHR